MGRERRGPGRMGLRARWDGSRWGRLLTLALALLGSPAGAATTDFDQWLATLREEARVEGISEATLDEALFGLEPVEEIIERDRNQVERRITFRTYKERVLSPERVARGRELYEEHRALLDRVAADYGVQPRFIVALWGIESTYGSYKGQHPVVASLATLAFDGRRASFFRGELLQALRIIDAGDIKAADMTGSWAGAMGQSQFMPSSYQAYAVDYDGDGRRDIWSSLPDVFASIANYLARAGWNPSYTWGRAVRLPGGIDGELVGLDATRSLPEWQALGVRRSDGRDLPAVPIEASLLRMDEGAGPTYLVYGNFKVLMRWNRSTYFGLSVGELSDLIAHG
jgi:membrane-bound lytic murein transglycosylase B